MASVKTRNGNVSEDLKVLRYLTPVFADGLSYEVFTSSTGSRTRGYSPFGHPVFQTFLLIAHCSQLATHSYILPSIEGGANKAVRGLTECQSEPQRGEHSPLCDGGRGEGPPFYPANPPSSSSGSEGVGLLGVGSGSSPLSTLPSSSLVTCLMTLPLRS